MKTATFLMLGLALTTTAAAGPADEVRCREIGFSKSVEAQDRELFPTFIDPDARFASNAVLRGDEAIADAWSSFFSEDSPRIKWRPQIVEVLEDGKLALSRGPFLVISKDDQDVESEHWGTFNSVWRLNDDGEWRVVFDAGSNEAESPTDEVKALLDQEDSCDEL